MVPRQQRSKRNSWHLLHFTPGIQDWLASRRSKMKCSRNATMNTDSTSQQSTVTNLQCRSCTMAPTTTSQMCCTRMGCNHRRIVMHQILVQSRVAKAFAQHCVTTRASIAQRSTLGSVAICMAWEFTLPTWPRRVTGTVLSQQCEMAVRCTR